MPNPNTNLADRSGGLVELFRNFQPRIVFLNLVVAGLLLLLVGGLAYRQLFQESVHGERGWRQSTRRIVTPGPRGEIYDRNGRVLVGNDHRLSVVLELDKIQREVGRQVVIIRKNYRDDGEADMPNYAQMVLIARVNIVQKYLDLVNGILGRSEQVDRAELLRHYDTETVIPYTLADNLDEDQFARLLEQLPIDSPVQVAKSAVRSYPYGEAAAHVLGEVKWENNFDAGSVPDDGMITLKTKGIVGRSGLESKFDTRLEGSSGVAVYRVNPAGYKSIALSEKWPQPGKNLTTSLDIDLQLAGEKAFKEGPTEGMPGAFVALDVNTGEVLAMASFPNYDLRETSPRVSAAKYAELRDAGAFSNRAINGLYFPGSTFKLVTSLAGFRNGKLTPSSHYVANGGFLLGNHLYRDAAGEITGDLDYRTALEASVNSWFMYYGLQIGGEAISAEADRFHLNDPTGIELPETDGSYVGNDAWKRNRGLGGWTLGDTALLSVGQGYISVTPLQMACLVASFARGETRTQPFLLHDAARPNQHTAPLDITPAQYNAMIEAMERVLTGEHGTARRISRFPELRTPGLVVAGKTGTAQKTTPAGLIELGWYVCFAPVDNPKIAIVAVVEGPPSENTGGGLYAAPVAHAILRRWWDRVQRTGGLP